MNIIFFGCNRVVISSASSKTSFSLAHLLHYKQQQQQQQSVSIVGITSKGSVPFVQRLGLYHQIVTYDEIQQQIPKGKGGVVYVDIAGNAKIRAKIQQQLGDELKSCLLVGMSHWDQNKAEISEKLEKTKDIAEVFFAPAWIKKRQQQLGAQLPKRMIAAWSDFMAHAHKYITICNGEGKDQLQQTYTQFLRAQVPADIGYVFTLHTPSAKSKL